MTGEDVRRLGEELGLDAVGVARAEAYDDTEQAIRDRRVARPVCRDEVHDGAAGGLLPSRDARARARAALSRPRSATGSPRRLSSPDTAGSRATPGTTPTRSSAGSSRQLGERLGGTYRVLVDANQHVDRAAAARSGVGFYGKNTLLITRRHGSWVVLGALVTDVEPFADAAARHRLRRLPPLHRRLPDGCARRGRDARLHPLPLVLDSGAARRPGAVSARSSELRSTAATSARTSARGTAASRSAATDLPATDAGHVDLRAWLESDGRRAGHRL